MAIVLPEGLTEPLPLCYTGRLRGTVWISTLGTSGFIVPWRASTIIVWLCPNNWWSITDHGLTIIFMLLPL